MYRLVSSRAAFRVPVAAQRRTMASAPQSSGSPKETAAATGGNTALLVGGVAALAGIAYWMTRSTEPSLHDVKRDARELKDVTVEKSEALADDAKARAEYDAGRAKASADSLVDRTKAASHEIKAGAEQGIYSAREKVSHAAEDAKREVQHGAEKVKQTGSSWFSWGKAKTEDAESDASKGVARQAEAVRVAADKRA
ncbi:hypothetical protein M422DRAFT_245248 [Sphaerobolus stellatus SS14]|nr:hypothetical protein M422DRAFT_245248 [Sphaerobolus stellatus SS14]